MAFNECEFVELLMVLDSNTISKDGYSKIYGNENEKNDDDMIYPTARYGMMPYSLLIVMVGLPARGKTYVAKKLCRYLNWIGIGSKVFNLGQYRRSVVGADKTHDFFDPNNKEANKIRNDCAIEALMDIDQWLQFPNHKIAIFDGTNTTRERRNLLFEFCKEKKIKLFFVESYCNDISLINDNIKQVKMFSPDYISMEKEEAYEDFMQRIRHYESIYKTMTFSNDKYLSFIKIVNAGDQFYINKIDGYIQSRVVYFLTNIHIRKRSIFLVLHGECNIPTNRQSSDFHLSSNGIEFAVRLGQYFKKLAIDNIKIWTSTLDSTVETAKYMNIGSWETWKALDGIKYGELHGMASDKIHELFMEQTTTDGNPASFLWSYPSGESYKDLVHRLEPIIMELERQSNVLLICHKTVMRCLLSYFLEKNSNELPFETLHSNTLIEIIPIAYGCRLEKIYFNELSST